MKYWPEFFLLTFLALASLFTVNNYRDIQTLEQNKFIQSELSKTIFKYSLEAISTVSPTIYHYDQHALYRLKIEKLLQSLQKSKNELIKTVRLFEDETTQYIQIATMLKTSNRFIASLANLPLNTPKYLQDQMSTLIALVNQIDYSNNAKVIKELNLYIQEHEDQLATIDEHGLQWKMIKLHVDFIIQNSNKIDINKEKNNAEKLIEYITKLQTSLAEQIERKQFTLFICIGVSIMCLLLC
ncbi:MAG: hypothetical protein ACPGJI_05995, partial [Kangiellaceae bacterium]